MNRVARAIVGSGLLLAAMVAMGALTRAPFRATPDRAELRLAWRLRVPQAEQCRRPTPEELAELPVHMRQEEICKSRPGRYRLAVAVDGRTVHSSTVEAAGARHDRPLYVFETVPLEPGTHRIRVVFERVDAMVGTGQVLPSEDRPGTDQAPQPGGSPQADTPGQAVPARLVMDRRVTVGARGVILVTYDADTAALDLHRDESR